MKVIVKSALDRARGQTGIPALAAGISLHGRHYFVTYGAIGRGGEHFRPDTVVEIGSCTKVFTTALFAEAVQAGKMGLNDSIQRNMPNGLRLKPRAQAVTLVELADFSSGMPEVPDNIPQPLEARSISNYTERDFFRFVANWQPSGPLPAPYLYSNASVGLLGYLVANALGAKWTDLLHERITAPLGMTDTTLELDGDQMSRLATGYRANGQVAPRWPIFAWYPAGGLRSTVRDMMKFADANLGHATAGGASVPAPLTAAVKLAHQAVFTRSNGIVGSAMAWTVASPGDERAHNTVIFKDGGTAGFNSLIMLDPASDLAIFLVANRPKIGINPLGYDIVRQIEEQNAATR